MIPLLLHRAWRGGPMPDEFVRYGRRWAELHPRWEMIDWLDDTPLPSDMPAGDIFALAREVAPRDHHRFEADVLRLQLLWTFGGVWADTDVEPLRPLDGLLLGVDCFASWSPHRARDGHRLLTNAVLGAVPHHPFIGACLDGLAAAVDRFQGRPLAQMVGPWHLSRVHDEHPEGVAVFDEYVFSPQHNRDRDHGEEPDLSESFAWHHWANSRKVTA